MSAPAAMAGTVTAGVPRKRTEPLRWQPMWLRLEQCRCGRNATAGDHEHLLEIYSYPNRSGCRRDGGTRSSVYLAHQRTAPDIGVWLITRPMQTARLGRQVVFRSHDSDAPYSSAIAARELPLQGRLQDCRCQHRSVWRWNVEKESPLRRVWQSVPSSRPHRLAMKELLLTPRAPYCWQGQKRIIPRATDVAPGINIHNVLWDFIC